MIIQNFFLAAQPEVNLFWVDINPQVCSIGAIDFIYFFIFI